MTLPGGDKLLSSEGFPESVLWLITSTSQDEQCRLAADDQRRDEKTEGGPLFRRRLRTTMHWHGRNERYSAEKVVSVTPRRKSGGG